MKRILDWLKDKQSQRAAPAETAQTSDISHDNEYTIEMSCGAEIPARSEPRDAAPEVVMPDIYGEKHETTEPLLKVLDTSSPDVDVSEGFNPYDTVVLHDKQGMKKS